MATTRTRTTSSSSTPTSTTRAAKTFTFPIYRDGSTTIPARAAADGMQDGIDFITALATHPETGRRLARKLWNFFVSEVVEPDESTLSAAAQRVPAERHADRIARPLHAAVAPVPKPWQLAHALQLAGRVRVRAVKEVGWAGFSVDTLRAPLTAMGQTLFEPPDVNGWDLGPGWFTTGGMLARMNFAADARGQSAVQPRARARRVRVVTRSCSRLLPRSALYRRRSMQSARNELLSVPRDRWCVDGSDAQLRMKAAGLARLIVGSGEYQIV